MHNNKIELSDDCPDFILTDFNVRRFQRGAPAASYNVDDGWLWMTLSDIRKNIKLFGEHPELIKGLMAYKRTTGRVM